MTVGLGEWASASASASSLRFHKDRARVLDEATPRSASRLAEGMSRFREVEQGLQPQMPQQEMPLGAGTFLQPGETMPPLTAAESRYFDVPRPVGEVPFAESEVGLAQRQREWQQGKSLTPEEIENLRPREGPGGILGALMGLAEGAGTAYEWLTDLKRSPTEAIRSLEDVEAGYPGLGEPDRMRSRIFEQEAQYALPPSHAEMERFFQPYTRPFAKGLLEAGALPYEAGEIAFEEVTGVPARGKVSGKIKGEISQDILQGFINPANIAMVAPFTMQGTAGLTGGKLVAQITSNLVATGMEPALIRGSLKGVTAIVARGTTALDDIPKVVRETPIIQDAVRLIREGEAGAIKVPGVGPEDVVRMRLTNDIPAIGEIRSRLVEIDVKLAEPKIKGGRPALLTERAKVQAQADIDEILASDLPALEQFKAIETELDGLRTELQTRGLPFRGKWSSRQFVPQEKDMPMGALSAEERAARPSAAQSRAAREARAEQRYPDLSTKELNARERVYDEFLSNARYEEVPAEELVGRARFTPEGEVIAEPTYATEGELAGVRAQQGELGIAAGERPVETAGPLFEQARFANLSDEELLALQRGTTDPDIFDAVHAEILRRPKGPGSPLTRYLSESVSPPPAETRVSEAFREEQLERMGQFKEGAAEELVGRRPLTRPPEEVVVGVGVQPGEVSGPPTQPPSPAAPPPEGAVENIVRGADAPPPGQPPTRGFADAAALPPEGAGNRFVGPLREFDDVVAEVVTRDDPIARALARTGINPSLIDDTDVGRTLTAYYRQRIAVDELTDVATAAALDVHAQPVTGRRGGVFSIAGDATIKRFPTKPGQSKAWMDVFSRPDAYDLTAAQRAYVDDYLAVVREAEAMRVAAGLKPRGVNKDGWLYVPRQVKVAKGVELRRPSNPALQRHFEEAQEGIAAGVKYSADPRANLEIHLRQAYREVLDKQLSDALTPLSVTPSEILRATNPKVVARMEAATQELMAATRARRSLIVSRGLEAIDPKAARMLRGRSIREGRGFRFVPGKMTAAQRQADARVATARAEFNAAKSPYRRASEAVRKTEVAPGQLFGKAEENIAVSQWRSRFFPREDADLLREGLGSFGVTPQQMSAAGRSFNTTGNMIRFLSSVGDFAMPFIQGLPTLGRRPQTWARMTLRHYQGFFDPTVQARIIREHLETFQKMAQHGTPIGDPEFFAALRRGEGVSIGKLTRMLPKGDEARELLRLGGRQTFGRFQASYNTGLGANRAFLYEAIRPTWKGTEADLWAHIRNMTGGLDSRALGVGPSQRGLESMWLAFSPRLFRSTVALVSDLRLGPLHPRGREAWRSLGQLVGGATGIYVLTGLGMGKSWEEIRTGLNPLEGRKFLSHEVNGDWVGIGGQVRAIVQMLAYTGRAAATGDADAFVSPNVLENPLLRAWSFRGAPAINIAGGAVEVVTGGQFDVLPFDDIDNLPDFLAHLGTSALPFSVQGKLEGGSWTSVPFEITGGRTTPEMLRDAFERKTGLNYSETPAARRREIIEADEELKGLAERYETDLGETAGRIRTERSAELLPGAQAVLQDLPGAGATYNDNRSGIMALHAGASQEAFRDLDIEPKGDDNKLLEQYYDVDFMTDRNGDGVPGDDEDVRLAIEERDGILTQISPDVRKAIENPANFFPDAGVVEVERMRDEAIEAMGQITAESRYGGLSVEDAETLDDFVTFVRQEWERGKRQFGDSMPSLPETALILGRKNGKQKLGEDAAVVLRGKAPHNQKRIDLALQHEGVLSRLFPHFLRSVLPAEVERGDLGEKAFERMIAR